MDTKRNKCNKRRCRVILNNMGGKKYNLTILSKHKNKVSLLREIITFSDDFIYNSVTTVEAPSLEATGDNKYNIETKSKKVSEPSVTSNKDNVMNNNENRDEKNNENSNQKNNNTTGKNNVPSPSIPKIDCDGNVIKHNISNEDELELAKINLRCDDLKDGDELSKYVNKKPFLLLLLGKYFWLILIN